MPSGIILKAGQVLGVATLQLRIPTTKSGEMKNFVTSVETRITTRGHGTVDAATQEFAPHDQPTAEGGEGVSRQRLLSRAFSKNIIMEMTR